MKAFLQPMTRLRAGPIVPGMAEHWWSDARRRTAVDVALALLVTMATSAGTAVLAARSAAEGRQPDVLAYGLLVLGAASLVLRRRRPVAVLAVIAATALAYDLLGYMGAFWLIPFAVALFTAMAARLRVQALAVAGTLFVVLVAVDAVAPRGHRLDGIGALWFGGWLVAALVAGEVARGRSDYLAEVERRAQEAERTREEEARRRAGEERLRIARELHDVLAHHIVLINVQAGVAAHLLHRQPEQAEPALLAIKQASKEALRELRATLGVLRQVDEEHGPRGPLPGLAHIDELVSGASAAGVTVDVTVEGAPREVPAGVDLAAYRIVQESLTNVTRHAGTDRANVLLRFEPHGLHVEITDEGPNFAAAPANGGNGIRGMRERVSALGGVLEAGPRPGGGFRVAATLPVEAGG